jgi:hypothetical protein
MNGSKYTDEDRKTAAIHYAIKGTLAAVERDTGIPDATVQVWTKTDWWETLISQARAEMEDQFRGKCHQVVEKATNETLDRLEHGDYMLDKEGNKKRLPMKGRDTAVIGAMYYDKLRLSLNLPTSITAGSGYKTAMNNLAAEFKRLSEQNRRVVAVQDSGESEISTGEEPNP